MSRRFKTNHWMVREYDRPANPARMELAGPRAVAMCGQDLPPDWMAKRVEDIGCLDCAKLYWAEKVKTLSTSLTLRRIARPDKSAKYEEKYRYGGSPSVFAVDNADGGHIGYVWLKPGWGAGWSCSGLGHIGRADDVKIEDLKQGYPIKEHMHTRDQAFFVFAERAAVGGYLTAEDYVAKIKRDRIDRLAHDAQRKIDDAANEVRRAAERAERERLKALDLIAAAEALAGMREIEDFGPDNGGLTNFQRAAVMYAIRILEERIS